MNSQYLTEKTLDGKYTRYHKYIEYYDARFVCMMSLTFDEYQNKIIKNERE